MNRWLTLSVALVFIAANAAVAIAQDTTQKPPQQATDAKPAADPKAEEAKKKAEEDKKKADDYDKFIKDLTKVEGAFTLYQKGKQLFLELPEHKLDQPFLTQLTWNTGAGSSLQAGDPYNFGAIDLFHFQKNEDKIWLTRPNTRYRWSKDNPLAISSERSFPTAILSQFNITQSHPAKKLMLVDVTSFFLGDVFRLNQVASFGLGAPFALNRDFSGPDRLKSFPKNTVVRMNLVFQSQGPGGGNPLAELLGLLGGGPQLEDPRSAPLKMTYNLWWREESDYVPRFADPRVGYFTQDYFSVDRLFRFDRQERLINRWNLKKKDPSAAMSEPVKPIVWTIDPSIPEKYRSAVREGVLMWNRAFEAIGFKNAVQVQDAPNDPDYDHADGRYNVIRLTMTEDASYAVALFRTDPMTGEIHNAAVTMDANVLSYALDEAADLVQPAANARERALAVMRRDVERRNDEFFLWATPAELAKQQIRNHAEKLGHDCFACDHPTGLAKMSSQALAMAQASGRVINRDEYLRQVIREFIVHEIGHCLGLRHNFVASTQIATNELTNEELIGRVGLAASVMDYNPVNTAAVLRNGKSFYSPVVGSYDMFAIRYGYQEFGVKNPNDERAQLNGIASLSTRPGHAYQTDQDADAFNPFVARFDFAKDPLAFNELNMNGAQRIRRYALRLNQADNPGRRTRLLLSSVGRVLREGRLSARFLGGVDAKRDFTGANLSPVDPKQQRSAARLIATRCFDAKLLDLPAEVRASLAQDRGGDENSSWTAPLRDLFGTQMILLFAQTMSAATLDRISENQLKWGANPAAYTMDEHYDLILGAIFAELNQTGGTHPVRRDIQQFAVNALVQKLSGPVTAVPADARVLANHWMRKLSKSLAVRIKSPGQADRMTQLHHQDLKETIDRFLARRATGL